VHTCLCIYIHVCIYIERKIGRYGSRFRHWNRIWLTRLRIADSASVLSHNKHRYIHIERETYRHAQEYFSTPEPDLAHSSPHRGQCICPESLTKPLRSSYPEGSFGGNQLLDGSISLSPLYPDSTNHLHVSIATK